MRFFRYILFVLVLCFLSSCSSVSNQRKETVPFPSEALKAARHSNRVGELGVNQNETVGCCNLCTGCKSSKRRITQAPKLQITESGYVTLSFMVDEHGNVLDITVLESYPSGLYDKAAVDSIKKWKFKPGKKDGVPIRSRVQQTIRFEPD